MTRARGIAATVAVAAAGWWIAAACAPDFPVAVFSYHRHPDLPRTEFIDGRLGVLQPTFARSYLVIAYRYLQGIGLDAGEREQARDYYLDRATASWDHIGTDWAAQWRAVRSRIGSPRPPATHLITGGTLAYDPETHSFALNCADDAFRVALQTLAARRRQFGADSEPFRSWIEAQDKVFTNCEGGVPVIPEQAGPELPPLIQADRNYQIASAHFYARQYQDALQEFRQISQDSSSPWRTLSRYLVARTLLRLDDSGKGSAELQSECAAILADPNLASIRGMTWNLEQRAGIRDGDENYFRDLATLLSTPGQDDGMREELWNYTAVYDKIIDDSDPNEIFAPSDRPAAADATPFRTEDLSDWIFSFQSRDAASFSHSLSRWRESRSSAWLLAALSHATATQAISAGLMNAAASLPASSPAYLTAQFHLQRLKEESGDKTSARNAVQTLLNSPMLRGLPSSANLFRDLAMLAAPDLAEFLQFAVRKPVMISFQTNIGEAPGYLADWSGLKKDQDAPRLDADAARVLNRETPYRLLKQAALGDSLPGGLHREALMTAFTRGLMLGQDLSDVARKLATADPEIADLANAYLRETSPDGRRFAAAFLLLQAPEARPYFGSGITRQTPPGKLDEYRDNWWCPVGVQAALDSRSHETLWSTPNVLEDSAAGIAPAFLMGDASTAAGREFAELSKLGAATDFLASIVFPYADSHREDPRVPEALHDLVRSGHYGCSSANTWKAARDAFRLLHLRYPASDWTRRTPTWVKNDADVREDGSAK